MSSARSTSPQTNKTIRAAQPVGSSSLGRVTSAHKTGAYDTPRGFGDEPLTVDQELAIELESVKRERQQLLDSISQVKAESGELREENEPVPQRYSAAPPRSYIPTAGCTQPLTGLTCLPS